MIQGTKDLKELSRNSSLIKISLKPPMMNPTTKTDGVRYETQTYLCTLFFFVFFCFVFFSLFFFFSFFFVLFLFFLSLSLFFCLFFNESAYSDYQ